MKEIKENQCHDIVINIFKHDDIEERKRAFNDKYLNYIINIEKKNGNNVRRTKA